MSYDRDRHHRRSIRLKGYDYAQPGAYFVTVCTHQRECVFGDVVNGEMRLNDAGRMAQIVWEALPTRFPTIELDEWIIMPNHCHGLIVISDSSVGASLVDAPVMDAPARAARAGTRPAPTEAASSITINWHPKLGDIVGAFKSISTDEYIIGVKTLGWPPFHKKVWQRNYYEHIVRNERELNAIRQYIQNNPLQWELDRDNPMNHRPEAKTVDEYLRDAGIL